MSCDFVTYDLKIHKWIKFHCGYSITTVYRIKSMLAVPILHGCMFKSTSDKLGWIEWDLLQNMSV